MILPRVKYSHLQNQTSAFSCWPIVNLLKCCNGSYVTLLQRRLKTSEVLRRVALKMKATQLFETSVNTRPTTQLIIPKDFQSQQHRCENPYDTMS
jgi:hypothetical protein